MDDDDTATYEPCRLYLVSKPAVRLEDAVFGEYDFA